MNGIKRVGATPIHRRQCAARRFVELDANHDGFVDQSEFVANGDSGQRFPGCDVDGDGKLTLHEFLACAQRPATIGQ